MEQKRRDKKGRVFLDGESQRADGRYSYRFTDGIGVRRVLYSWRLTEADKTPAGKRPGPCLREMEKEARNDPETTSFDDRKVTLNEYFDRYIRQKSVSIRLTTYNRYQWTYDRYVRKQFGRKRLCELRHSDFAGFYSRLVEVNGLDPQTVSDVHGLLHQTLESAVLDGVIVTNPSRRAFDGVRRLLNAKEKTRVALTQEQQKRFLEFTRSSERFKMHYPILLFMAGTGCRIGEASGIRWEDVDFTNRTISVNHSLANKFHGSVKDLMVQQPKTKKSVRVIPMLDEVEALLKEEYGRQKAEGFCKAEVDGYSGFVFSHSGGSLYTSYYLCDILKKVVKVANAEPGAVRLPSISPHILRHTFCTRLCENVRNVKVIQNIMGHSSIVMTMDVYTDLTVDVEREQIKAVNGKISPA